MFATRLGRGLGSLQLGLLPVCAGEAAGCWACGACHARPYVSGGRERPPGSDPEVCPPGPARRTLKKWALLSQKLHVQTRGGKVICLETVYGNIDIHASDKSTVIVDKVQ
uniref:Family with sequence similarity 185 member A n=1 Tax=Molossus molossus TaxID=27622 RepID=A0A7J8HAQ8_MOLMO|nr:family with sequence similarity 185 member A [Molossus molossus]